MENQFSVSDSPKNTFPRQQRTMEIRVNDELQELIRKVADDFQISESEAAEELIYSVLVFRRVILAGREEQKTFQDSFVPLRYEITESKKRTIDQAALIISLAFAIGALLAVVYVLLIKK